MSICSRLGSPELLRAVIRVHVATALPHLGLLILDPILARQIFDFTRAVSMFLVSEVIFVSMAARHIEKMTD